MPRFWIGVASRDHVRRGVSGGFCQLGHGKVAPLKRLSPGDAIIYYSPRERLDGGEPIQAFTAIGEVLESEPRQVEMANGYKMFRRSVRFAETSDAPIRPLLPRLDFAHGPVAWGMSMRRGLFDISRQDYEIIADAMGARDLVVQEIATALLQPGTAIPT
jgi:hypothetical protein